MRYHRRVDKAHPDPDQDPVVAALMRDVDATLLQRNLKLTPQQRIEQLMEMQRFAVALREAGRKARRGQ